jgi:hypothetical protein
MQKTHLEALAEVRRNFAMLGMAQLQHLQRLFSALDRRVDLARLDEVCIASLATATQRGGGGFS